jgi:hypothetical protein
MSITVAAVVGLIVGLMVGVPLGLVGRPRWWTVCLRLPEELHRRLREEATENGHLSFASSSCCFPSD